MPTISNFSSSIHRLNLFLQVIMTEPQETNTAASDHVGNSQCTVSVWPEFEASLIAATKNIK